MAAQIVARLFFPALSPRGLTTVIIGILFIGSPNLFAVGLVGEYIAKMFEEVKRGPHFIRRSTIRGGEVLPAVLSDEISVEVE